MLDSGSPQHSQVGPALAEDADAVQKDLGEVPGDNTDEDEDLQEIDWGDAEAEIQAFLDETDDEDSQHVDTIDGHTSDEEASGGLTEHKKRALTTSSTSAETSGSPLAKRRKMAAARAGQSKLKLSRSAEAEEDGDETGDEGEDEELDDFAKALEGELM